MYPLNMQSPDGFALANDVAEHQALSAAGFLPALVASRPATAVEVTEPTRAELLAQLEAAGVRVDKRWSDTRLAEEIAKA